MFDKTDKRPPSDFFEVECRHDQNARFPGHLADFLEARHVFYVRPWLSRRLRFNSSLLSRRTVVGFDGMPMSRIGPAFRTSGSRFMLKHLVFVVCCGAAVAGIARSEEQSEKVPDEFRVEFETSAGELWIGYNGGGIEGADRFHDLIKQEFYNDARFFRVVPNFVVQFGINGDPDVQSKWRQATIEDDPVVTSNLRGFLVFATSGPNSRTTQLFINLKDNQRLDGMGFAPFARVVKGMDVVDAITSEYGERANQGQIQNRGNAYLKERFPNMDYIKSAKIVTGDENKVDEAPE